MDNSNQVSTVSQERLLEIIGAYGADFDRWPLDEYAAAQATLAQSEAARQALEEASRLDAALDRMVPPEPSDALVARLTGAIAHGGGRQHGARLAGFLSGLTRARLRPASAFKFGSMTAVFVLGIMVGWLVANQPGPGAVTPESFVFSLVGGPEAQVVVTDLGSPVLFTENDLMVALH